MKKGNSNAALELFTNYLQDRILPLNNETLLNLKVTTS